LKSGGELGRRATIRTRVERIAVSVRAARDGRPCQRTTIAAVLPNPDRSRLRQDAAMPAASTPQPDPLDREPQALLGRVVRALEAERNWPDETAPSAAPKEVENPFA
jgi:hypothetical protein